MCTNRFLGLPHVRPTRISPLSALDLPLAGQQATGGLGLHGNRRARRDSPPDRRALARPASVTKDRPGPARPPLAGSPAAGQVPLRVCRVYRVASATAEHPWHATRPSPCPDGPAAQQPLIPQRCPDPPAADHDGPGSSLLAEGLLTESLLPSSPSSPSSWANRFAPSVLRPPSCPPRPASLCSPGRIYGRLLLGIPTRLLSARAASDGRRTTRNQPNLPKFPPCRDVMGSVVFRKPASPLPDVPVGQHTTRGERSRPLSKRDGRSQECRQLCGSGQQEASVAEPKRRPARWHPRGRPERQAVPGHDAPRLKPGATGVA